MAKIKFVLLFLAITLVLALPACTCGSTPTPMSTPFVNVSPVTEEPQNYSVLSPEEWATYEEAVHNFSVQHPDEWATYTYRLRVYRWSGFEDDKRVFPSRNIENQAPAFHFKTAGQTRNIGQVTYTFAGKTTTVDFEKYLEESRTTALILIKDDTLVYEKYLNGYTRDSINRSFSMAKSFTSTLVGLAVEDGYIHSINDTIVTYLPELKNHGVDGMTIRDLMVMNSGIPFTANDEAMAYWLPNMRDYVLTLKGGKDPIGAYFFYNNWHALLEGVILERTTHKTVSSYMEEKIWKPLGMEYPASWSLDSTESGFEQMGAGINARAIDFAKFGRLFLNDGYWDGRRILPGGWVKEATSPDPTDTRVFKNYTVWQEMGGYYKYHWWGMHNQDGTYDYSANGHLGQIIYVSPKNNAIFVRNGFAGDPKEWAMIARSVFQSLKY